MTSNGIGNQDLHRFVQEALLRKSSAPQYSELKALLKEYRKAVDQDPASEAAVANLAALLGALSANVSAIRESRHQAMVSDVLGIKLWAAPQAVREAALTFTANLTVANSAFTHTCLQLLVYSFTPPPTAPPAPGAPGCDLGRAWRPSADAAAVQRALLASVSRVMGLMPTAASHMLPLLLQQMPHKLRDRNTQCLYLGALFAVAEDRAGGPVRETLLTAVVEQLLSLDVEIKWEQITDVPTGEDEEEDDDEGLDEDVFELEGLANELDINADPDTLQQRLEMRRGGWEGAAGGAAAARPGVDEMADKLDSMMELTFAHMARRIDAGELPRVWETLLGAFERSILNTHRSKFTQYLLFYTCLRAPSYCPAALVALLLDRLRDALQPAITRAACAAYLASFLARAAFLPHAAVVGALQQLAAFCQEYLAALGPSASVSRNTSVAAGLTDVPGIAVGDGVMGTGAPAQTLVQRHQVLFAAVQAILYVLCYHMGPIISQASGLGGQQQQQRGSSKELGTQQGASSGRQASSGGSSPGLASASPQQLGEAVAALVRGPVWAVLSHKLQPLAACLPTIGREFTQQALAYGVVDCRPLLPKEENRAHRPLEVFFPFDPYLLRRSSRYLQLKQSYVQWRHGHPATPSASDVDGAAAGGAEHGVEDGDDEEQLDGASSQGVEEDGEVGSTSSGLEDEDDDEDDSDADEDEGLAGGHSLGQAGDTVLHDPKHRLAFQPFHRGHHQPGTAAGLQPGQPVHVHHQRAHNHNHHHHHQHAPAALLGTSYMSYMSNDTTSQGGGSPLYGASPCEGGDMLVRNPLGASPGVVPMSFGTPDVGRFMAQVPLRIGHRH